MIETETDIQRLRQAHDYTAKAPKSPHRDLVTGLLNHIHTLRGHIEDLGVDERSWTAHVRVYPDGSWEVLTKTDEDLEEFVRCVVVGDCEDPEDW